MAPDPTTDVRIVRGAKLGGGRRRPGRLTGQVILSAALAMSSATTSGGCVEDGTAATPPQANPATTAPIDVQSPPPPPRPEGDRGAGFGTGPVTAGPTPPRGSGGSDVAAPPAAIPPVSEMPRSPAGLPMLPIEVKGERFLMELCLDETTRRRGLGGRRTLARDRGMLFAHPRPEILGYWMKDCFMDIDIVYVDALGRVTATYRMKAEPPRRADESITAYQRRLPSYSSRRSAALALEFAPGTLDRLDLRPGEDLGIDVTALRGLAKD